MKLTAACFLMALFTQSVFAETVRERDERIAANRAQVEAVRAQVMSACKRYGELLQVAWDYKSRAAPKKPEKLLDMDSNIGRMLWEDIGEAVSKMSRESANIVATRRGRALTYNSTQCFTIRNPKVVSYDFNFGDDGLVFNPKEPVFAPWFNQAKFDAMLDDYEWNFRNPESPR